MLSASSTAIPQRTTALASTKHGGAIDGGVTSTLEEELVGESLLPPVTSLLRREPAIGGRPDWAILDNAALPPLPVEYDAGNQFLWEVAALIVARMKSEPCSPFVKMR